MNILITGGAGFVGLSLIEQLLKKEEQLGINKITILDNLMFKETCCLPLLRHPKVEIVVGDVRDKDLLIKLTKESDTIFALAGLVGMPICKKFPQEAWDINYGHVETICDKVNPNTKLLYVCTNSIFGNSGGIVTEESEKRCISVYSQSKYQGELKILSKQGISMRFATLAGLGWRQRRDLLVNTLTFKALTDKYVLLYEKDALRCYLSVNDAARALVHALENYETMKGQPYNTANDSLNCSKLQLAEKIKEFIPEFVIKTDDYFSDEDKRNYACSSQKLYSTGFKCEEGFDIIIPQLIKGYRVMMEVENYMLT